MAATFDAYHKWLGIPPKDQPPNHYRLLSLEPFESDLDVIDAGANRQMAYLHQRATGQHAALSQELLNAISAARMCLLDPNRKAAYDDELRAKSSGDVPNEEAEPRWLGEDWTPPAEPAFIQRRRSPKTLSAFFWKLIGFGGSAVVSPYLAILILMAFGQPIPEFLRFLPGLGGVKEPAKQQVDQRASSPATPRASSANAAPAGPPQAKPTHVVQAITPKESVYDTDEQPIMASTSPIEVTEADEESDEVRSTTSGSSEDHLPTDIADSKTTKLPVPDDDDQKKATALIRDVYKADYDKAKSQAQKLELAKKLLQDGEQTEGDPTGRFVLLRIARDLATQAGDVSVTTQAIDQIATTYEVDLLEMQVAALTKLSKSVSTVAAQKELVEVIENITDTAVDKDGYSVAQQLAGLALTVSRKTKDSSLLKIATARSKEIDQRAAAYVEVQKALKVLDEKPTDPDANLIVGKFRCLIENKWDDGLPLLARSDDATLKELAEKELGDTSEPDVEAALGDGWWDISEKETGSSKTHLRLRAVHWYMQALPELRGLPKAKLEKRLAEITPEEPSPSKAPAGQKNIPQEVFLADLQETNVKVDSGWFSKDGKMWDKQIAVNGVLSPKGLFMHPSSNASSQVSYTLNHRYKRFNAVAAIPTVNGTGNPATPLSFEVWGDDVLLWRSDPLSRKGQASECKVAVAKVNVLQLKVLCPGANNWACAVWLEPRLTGTLHQPHSRTTTRSAPLQTVAGVKHKWDQFTLKGSALEGGVVRIAKLSEEQKRDGDWRKSGDFNEIRTKDDYVGGVEITVVARTDKHNIRITGPRNSLVIFNWELDTNQVRVTRPIDFSIATAPVEPLLPGEWYALQFRVGNDGIGVSINGNLVFSEERQYDLSTKSTAAVWSWDSDLEVKSFIVTPINDDNSNSQPRLKKEMDSLPKNVDSKRKLDRTAYPKDAVEFGGHHYKVYWNSVPWNVAYQECRTMKGHLACVETTEEERFLAKLKGDGKVVWVGATKEGNNWRWINGVELADHRVVDQRNGHNWAALCATGEINCRIISGELKPATVEMIQGFICEWEPARQ